MPDIGITNIRIVPASSADQDHGLLAFASITINGLVIDGITVRRTLDDRVVLDFPKRTDRAGRQRSIVHPADDSVRAEITRAVLTAIDPSLIATAGADP